MRNTLSRRPLDSVMITAVGTYTFLADGAVLTEAQTVGSQLASIKLQLEQGAAIECGSPGLRKCFLKDGLICREYKESATQLTHTHNYSDSRESQFLKKSIIIWAI